MIKTIAQIIFAGSLLGIGTVFIRKIPALKNLPLKREKTDGFFSKIREKINFFSFIKKINWEVLLQKVLSRIKILSLRVETRTSGLLLKLRERAKQKKEREDYWKRLTKISLKLKRKKEATKG